MKRSPVNRQRETPRRGRVIDEAYLDWADGQPCCITKKFPATSHHVRFCGSPKDDTRIVRLAPELHMHGFGMNSIERLGKEKFEAFHGIKLEAEIVKLRQQYEKER
jgi:hypothetical protein